MALPDKYEDWRLPTWLTDGSEIDPDKVGRAIFNGRKVEEELKARVSEKDTEIQTIQNKLDDAEAGKSGTDEDAQNELKALRQENRQLKDGKSESRPEDQKRIWQLEAALDLGLSPRDAARLVGKDKDEILSDAKEFAKDHGIDISDGDDGEDEDDGDEPQSSPPQQAPRLRSGFEKGNQPESSNPSRAAKTLESVPLFS